MVKLAAIFVRLNMARCGRETIMGHCITFEWWYNYPAQGYIVKSIGENAS